MTPEQRGKPHTAASGQWGGAEDRLGRRDATLTQLEGLRSARRRLGGGSARERRACVHLRTVRGI